MAQKNQDLSSRQLLDLIGLSEEAPLDLLEDEPLDGLNGDLGAILRERYRSFIQPHRFAPGDLVCWKPGMRNHRLPRYGQPVVVLEVLETPLFDAETDAGSTYFRERRDLVLGMIWETGPGRGDFISFHFDRRRWQPWTQEH
ncbi:MAG: hypothetical protein JZU52_14235 [Lamprocystis purpurea]|uniref:hypothetical protein n=1 Tax=Lamprocystis purpurea TaxID=61598 RepID=UPI0003A36D2B|nr:hypothetical protein [Lamprocystis purpurea]MBV5274741.1 hypothetical protein [Lamprocystis purpurea]